MTIQSRIANYRTKFQNLTTVNSVMINGVTYILPKNAQGKLITRKIKQGSATHRLLIRNFPSQFENNINLTIRMRRTGTPIYKMKRDDFKRLGFRTKKQGLAKVRLLKSQNTVLHSFEDLESYLNLHQHQQQEDDQMDLQEENLNEDGNVIKFSDLQNDVKKWNSENNPKNEFFEIIIQSAISDVKRTFRFNCIEHFTNWIQRVIKDTEGKIDDYGYILAELDVDDLFSDYVILENINIVSGGCNKHKLGKNKTFKSAFYDFKLHNPYSENNNCFFRALEHISNIKIDVKRVRKTLNLIPGQKITIGEAYQIMNHFNIIQDSIQIIDSEHNFILEDDVKYILLLGSHYFAVDEYKEINLNRIKTKRGFLMFDFETRKTSEYNVIKRTGQQIYKLKDAICGVYFRKYKSIENESFVLRTTKDKSSARQFLNWLNEESKHPRSYNILAHNGGRFDFYFLIAEMTDRELLECKIQMRGTAIIGITYRGNLFRDSYAFLTSSLKDLSTSFNVNNGKKTEHNLHGQIITSEQLCFYKPKLGFDEFMDLQNTDTQFWSLYEEYCLYDCISLFEIWEKFTTCINSLIEKVNPYLLRKCALMSSTTIGSHSKKIIVELNKYGGYENKYKKAIDQFTGVYYEEERNNKEMSKAQSYCVEKGDLPRSLFYRHVKKYDKRKYSFLCKFKRGGISHCNKKGKHMSGITGVDIASQYPASLIYSYIPCGFSYWIDNGNIVDYNKDLHGFYRLKNVRFNSPHLFKPVASKRGEDALDWATNDFNELYVDTYMINYLIENYGLIYFDIVQALVSQEHVKSDKIFGSYINPFYACKKQQDEYKKKGDPLYNEALRSTIKLYINSLTGKLVEDPSKHYSLKLHDRQQDDEKIINGVGIERTFNEEKINEWIVCGIMVYSYSKRLLFEYIRCLPNDSSDVIHVETDGIYFSTRLLDTFTENVNNYQGYYPVKFGDDVGNLKIEKSTKEGQVAYFLEKKLYMISVNNDYMNKQRDKNDKNIYRVKGVPQSTLSEDGSRKYLVDVQLYEDLYNWKPVKRSFNTLKKSLFTEKTAIYSYEMTRVLKPASQYRFYN